MPAAAATALPRVGEILAEPAAGATIVRVMRLSAGTLAADCSPAA